MCSQAYPVLYVLWFALTIIHGCRRAAKTHICQRKPKNRKKRGRGTRLIPNAIADSIYTLLTVYTVYFQATISHGMLNEVRIGVYIIGILTYTNHPGMKYLC